MRRIAVVLLGVICLGVQAQEVTKWRGPSGDGIYPDKDLLDTWPANGPEVLWNYDEIGEGYSSPSFANGKIYVSGMLSGEGYVFVLSQEGKLLDKFSYGDEWDISYPGARSTVTVAGDLMYIMSGKGSLVCMESATGKVKWDRHMFRDFDGRNIRWGITESVVVSGDKVYCTPGGSRYNIVALDRFTGNTIWASRGKGNLSAYCTPLLVKLPQKEILLTHTASNIICVDAADGNVLWTQNFTNTYAVHPNTPLYHDGGIYLFSGYGKGGMKISVSENGSKQNVLWKEGTLDSRMGGAVLINGYIYGSGDANRSWKSLNWKTGKQGYQSTEVGNGVIIAADGKLFLYSQRGELAMAAADPENLKITGRTRVTMGSGPHWAHPVINNGRLFVRHGNVLIAYKIK